MNGRGLLIYHPLSFSFGGGFERIFLQLAPRLVKTGFEVTIIATDYTGMDDPRIPSSLVRSYLADRSVKYIELKSYPFLLGSPTRMPVIAPTARPILERAVKTCDVVYFDNAYALQDLAFIGLKFRYRKPVISGHHSVLFHHTLHDLYVNLVSRNVIRFFDAIHVLNSDDASVLSKWGAKNVHLIPLGVDTDRFTPSKSYGEGRTMKVALVGRLTEQKGIDKFLLALAIINSDPTARERTEFTVVGSGPLAPLVRAAALQHGNLRYVGPVDDDRLLEIYRDSDLIVMPSRQETMGIVALEAQACGLPVIAARASGLSDIIMPDVTGTILRRNEADELASAILFYLDLRFSDFARYVRMRTAARENVQRRFSLEQTTRSLSRMIMNVADSGFASDLT